MEGADALEPPLAEQPGEPDRRTPTGTMRRSGSWANKSRIPSDLLVEPTATISLRVPEAHACIDLDKALAFDRLFSYGARYQRGDWEGRRQKGEAWKAVSEYDYIAVVDPELRVRGMEGLRVADASGMIGEKAADLVRGAAEAQPA